MRAHRSGTCQPGDQEQLKTGCLICGSKHEDKEAARGRLRAGEGQVPGRRKGVSKGPGRVEASTILSKDRTHVGSGE